MIYVTGDTHGLENFQKLNIFANENRGLSRSDVVLICGDCGVVWNEKTLNENIDFYSELPFTVAFADGNHENFDMLEAFPVATWHGGRVHKISENVFHLIRGEVFEIEGNKIFAFGGATSTDKNNRTLGISWWEMEVPSYSDYDNAIKNLEKNDYKVDYVITHTCDEKALYYPALRKISKAQVVFQDNRMLSNFEELLQYKRWYFGHYHIDADVTDKKTALFDKIIKLGNKIEDEVGAKNDNGI